MTLMPIMALLRRPLNPPGWSGPDPAQAAGLRHHLEELAVNTHDRVLEPGSRISAQGRRWTFSFRTRILAL